MSNSNYFLAISIRVNPPKKYFLGVVTCAKEKTLFDLKLLKRDSLLTDCELSQSTVSKRGILAFPTKDMTKEYHRALREYFKGKHALLAWAKTKLDKEHPNMGGIDFFNIIIGKIKNN